jgi:hypothetical protein
MTLEEWLYNNPDLNGWPDGDDREPLDTENLHIIAVTRRGIDFCCGGDWQSPQWLLLRLDCTIEVVVNDLDQIVGYGCEEPDLSRWIGRDGGWKTV